MESSGLCLQYFIGMGNFPRNCKWMKLDIGHFEKIVFGNRLIFLASYGNSKMFVDGHLEHKCSFLKMGLPYYISGWLDATARAVQSWIKWDVQLWGFGSLFTRERSSKGLLFTLLFLLLLFLLLLLLG
jgi:hypothetical protein